MITEKNFPTIEAAARTLADEITGVLQAAIARRGHALLAVSGGRTPRHVFEHLLRQPLDWERVTITLTDERWVPPDHPDSNENLVRSYLLQGPASLATFVPLYGGEISPMAGQVACEARLKVLPIPFDAVYLGMGDDGHFASLFPGDAAVDARESRCVAVPATETRQPRMSLTAPAVLDARNVYLLFSGKAKHEKYAEAKRPGSVLQLPLRLVLLQSRTPVTVLTAP